MRYVKLWDEDGTVAVMPDEEPRIDAAVSEYLNTGRDSLLDLELVSAAMYKTRASLVRSWMMGDADTRRREIEYEKAQRDEAQAVRHELGIWSDDDE